MVEEWLGSIGYQRTDYDLAWRDELGRKYCDEWDRRTPYTSQKYAAVLGGWHIMWPEDEFYMPKEMELVIWTFRDSEP